MVLARRFFVPISKQCISSEGDNMEKESQKNQANVNSTATLTPSDNEWEKLGEYFKQFGFSSVPSCIAPYGIYYDFCNGLRTYIQNPPQEGYRFQYWDTIDGVLCYDNIIKSSTYIQSNKSYYRPYFIRISDVKTGKIIFEHKMDLRGQVVLMYFPNDTIGDTLAWFKAIEVFQEKHNCLIYVAVSDATRKILENAHPEMRFISREQARTIRPYAGYVFGVSYDNEMYSQQMDFRTVPLHWRGADILGLDAHTFQDTPPKISFDKDSPSPIEGKYVAISSMASGGCKLWLNPHGWRKVVSFLKENGYRVIDIDGKAGVGAGYSYQFIPREAEDFTGTGEGKELPDRARLIYHADFFIGLGSGLSWLSWCIGKPTVLISGFSEPWCEFYTPYRVINTKVCHGCFNDVRYKFDQTDCFWCPRLGGTKRQLECSTQITAEQVINTIKQIPVFKSSTQKDTTTAIPVITPSNANNATGASQIKTTTWNVVNNTIVESNTNNATEALPYSIKPGQNGASELIKKIQKQLNTCTVSRKKKDTLGIDEKDSKETKSSNKNTKRKKK